MGNSLARHPYKAERLDAEKTLPVVVWNVVQPAAARATGAVDEYIQASQFADRGLDCRSYGLRILEIELNGDSAQSLMALAKFVGQFGAKRLGASKQRKMHAFACKRLGDGVSNAATCSSD